MRRIGSAGAVLAAGLLLVTGCSGGGSDSGPRVTKALAESVPKGCGHYLKPESVAAALGANKFAGASGRFRDGKGSCSVDIKVGEAGRDGMDGPQHINVKFSLEIFDWGPALVAESLKEKCHAAGDDGVTSTFKGPKGACGVYRAEPTEEFLVGGRLDAYAGEGRKLLTITFHGVDGTLKKDRGRVLRLLADARAEARAQASGS
ncbi:hypothetical protein [Streptomyces sp. NPDC058045]|uniref:hypothetical protein n=1 Tax=Streptomyces sp. NPDC058045 TaxID=3346311 RepID=UPI0036E8192C